MSPVAQYRGAENQLYRVEIHSPGPAGGASPASFKWSRDNGSRVFGILGLQGAVAVLADLGHDQACGLRAGDWVEIVDDHSELLGRPYPLLQVDQVDPVTATATLSVPQGLSLPVFGENTTTHPFLRRWDQKSNAIPIQESRWIELEDGVQVWFEQGGDYKTGDHWLIPARVATGDVLWPVAPGPDGRPWPQAEAPRGIVHHIAPLRQIEVDAAGKVICGKDCRCVFPSLCELAHMVRHDPDNMPDARPTPKERPIPVIEVKGVGAVLAERLRAAGTTLVTELVALDADRLAGLLTEPGGREFPRERAEDILRAARAMTHHG